MPVASERIGRTVVEVVADRRRRVRREPWVSACALPTTLPRETRSVRATPMRTARAETLSPAPRPRNRTWVAVLLAPFAVVITLTAVLIVARFAAMLAKLL